MIKFIIFSLLLLTTISNNGGAMAQLDDDNNCDPRDGLCKDDYCFRKYSYNSFYDLDSDQCICSLDSNDCLTRFPELSCPINSSPSPVTGSRRLTCQCNPGYIKLQSRYCLPEKHYGESCNDTLGNTCVQNSKCTNGVCACKEYEEVWDEFSKLCRIRSFKPCFDSTAQFCVSNSDCARNARNSRYEICNCRDGYVASDDGWCLGGLGSRCEQVLDCSPGLHCIDGVCACRNLAADIFDPVSKACVTAVGEACDLSSVCAENSFCNTTIGHCDCNTGFNVISKSKNSCLRAAKYNEECKSSECATDKGLGCVDGKCDCLGLGLTYHNDTESCLAPVGRRCGVFDFGGNCLNKDEECRSYDVKCEPPSECKEDFGRFSICK